MKISSMGPRDAVVGCNNCNNNINSNVKSTSVKGTLEAKISDSVELSEGAQKFSALLKQAKESLGSVDAKEDVKAADILSKIQDGSYQVSSDTVVHDILSGFPSNSV